MGLKPILVKHSKSRSYSIRCCRAPTLNWGQPIKLVDRDHKLCHLPVVRSPPDFQNYHHPGICGLFSPANPPSNSSFFHASSEQLTQQLSTATPTRSFSYRSHEQLSRSHARSAQSSQGLALGNRLDPSGAVSSGLTISTTTSSIEKANDFQMGLGQLPDSHTSPIKTE